MVLVVVRMYGFVCTVSGTSIDKGGEEGKERRLKVEETWRTGEPSRGQSRGGAHGTGLLIQGDVCRSKYCLGLQCGPRHLISIYTPHLQPNQYHNVPD